MNPLTHALGKVRYRAHQIPLTDVATNPGQLLMLEKWLRSYKPEELFDDRGRLLSDLRAVAPTGFHMPFTSDDVARKTVSVIP